MAMTTVATTTIVIGLVAVTVMTTTTMTMVALGGERDRWRKNDYPNLLCCFLTQLPPKDGNVDSACQKQGQ